MPPAREGLRHNLRERDLCHPLLESGLSQQGHAEEQPQSGRISNSPPHSYTKRPTAPICCPNGSRAHTISCLGVGACLKVNTRALGRGALWKVDSIPLSLTSEKEGLIDNSQLDFSPRFPSYHLVKHAFCILYKPQTPANHYLYRLLQTTNT